MNILALDLGSHQIKAAIVKATGKKLDLLSQSNVPTAGIKIGKVTSMDKASSSISKAIEKVRENISIHIDKTVVSVNTCYLKSYKARAKLVLDAGVMININDIKKALENARNQAALSNHEVALHVLPYRFYASSSTIVEDPLGMCASSFILEANIVAISQDDLNNIRRILELAGISNYELVADIYADSIYALKDDEKGRNTALVDIGHDTCQMAIYMQNSIAWLDSLPFGSNSISNDLVDVLKIQENVANRLKIEHLHYEDSAGISVTGKDGNAETLSMEIIRKVINTRINEMLDASCSVLRKSDHGEEYNSAVFVGGLFNIPQIKERAKPIFDNMTVRINTEPHPCFMSSECQALYSPEYACLFGLCMYGAGYHTNYELNVNGVLKTNQKTSLLSNLDEEQPNFTQDEDSILSDLNLNNSLNMEQNLHAKEKELLLSDEDPLLIKPQEADTKGFFARLTEKMGDKLRGLF